MSGLATMLVRRWRASTSMWFPGTGFHALKGDRQGQHSITLIGRWRMVVTSAHGAMRWLTPDKAVIQLSLRGSWADIFWFTLFHELGHVLKHGRRAVFIEWPDGEHQDDREREADQFAADALIPRKAYEAFLGSKPILSAATVAAFADQQSVAPGIVVGRLQHERKLPYSVLNSVRVRYRWKESASDGPRRE